MYIIVYTLRTDPRVAPDTDHWQACETPEEADEVYAALLERDDLYSASKCSVLESTDYEPTEKSFYG